MNKIITRSELDRLSLSQLYGYQRSAFEQLIRSSAGSNERRTALANLENINRAISLRLVAGFPQP